MPGRIVPLVNGEFYHIFNRGSEKREIFLQPRDYSRFQQTFYYYQFIGPKPKFSNFAKFKLSSFKPLPGEKFVDIICYCLMPNHFHFLVRQLKDGGVSKFVSQLSNSYTKFFNTKYDRVGPLFQGAFKAVRVKTDEQLIYLSSYIHLNPIKAKLARSIEKYPWSSYHEYSLSNTICLTDEILNLFSSRADYKKFIIDQKRAQTMPSFVEEIALDY